MGDLVKLLKLCPILSCWASCAMLFVHRLGVVDQIYSTPTTIYSIILEYTHIHIDHSTTNRDNVVIHHLIRTQHRLARVPVSVLHTYYTTHTHPLYLIARSG